MAGSCVFIYYPYKALILPVRKIQKWGKKRLISEYMDY